MTVYKQQPKFDLNSEQFAILSQCLNYDNREDQLADNATNCKTVQVSEITVQELCDMGLTKVVGECLELTETGVHGIFEYAEFIDHTFNFETLFTINYEEVKMTTETNAPKTETTEIKVCPVRAEFEAKLPKLFALLTAAGLEYKSGEGSRGTTEKRTWVDFALNGATVTFTGLAKAESHEDEAAHKINFAVAKGGKGKGTVYADLVAAITAAMPA